MNADAAPDRPIVTVYVTSRDYGHYLRECLDSIVAQSLPHWELLVFDDGSTDDTREIAESYARRDPDRVRVIATDTPRGLRACANEAIRSARGRYLIRLDADDYLDESAFLVLAGRLDEDRDLGLVYPNWTYVSEAGEVLGVERRKRLGTETEIYDLPPHGACTMVRLRALKVIGGYDESFDAQDGHELWLRLRGRYSVASVATPLFFYRQHGSSMSRDEDRLLAARRAIKRQAAQRYGDGDVRARAVAIVPVKNSSPAMPNIALEPVAGRPLVDHTLEAAEAAGCFDLIYVTTDDPAVVQHCAGRGGVVAELRPPELSADTAKLTDVATHAVQRIELGLEVAMDVVVLLNAHTPLRRSEHIQEAIDTLLLYDCDHVISTYEDLDIHFRHGSTGMIPLNPGMTNQLRYEREALFVDNGAVHAFWRDLVSTEVRLDGRVGHTVMARSDSLQIKSLLDRDVVAAVLEHRGRMNP